MLGCHAFHTQIKIVLRQSERMLNVPRVGGSGKHEAVVVVDGCKAALFPDDEDISEESRWK